MAHYDATYVALAELLTLPQEARRDCELALKWAHPARHPRGRARQSHDMTKPARMSPQEAKARMRDLIADAELPEPDEITHDAENDELNLIWHEQRLVVIIALTDRRAASLTPPV